MHKLLINGHDVTKRAGDITSTEDLDQLSVQLSFCLAHNPHDKYLPPGLTRPGDRVQLFNNSKMIFQGILIQSGLDGTAQVNDFGFYLNKSKVILQCNGVPADDAIRQLCKKAGVSLGSIPALPTIITEVFIAQEPSAILKTILERVTAERGTKYFMRVEPDKGLCIYPYPTSPVKLSVQLARNLRPFDPTWSLGGISGTDSMESLKNQVIIYHEEDKQARVLATASDSGSIGKYGWLQEMETADEGTTAAQARQMAATKLSALNRLTLTRNVTDMLGADVRAGTMLHFSSDKFGFGGNWTIKQVTHTYAPSGHTMSMEVFQP